MTITVNIHFEGLCAFVPRSSGEISVLLPDARNQDGQTTNLCNSTDVLRPHFPEILYFDTKTGRPETWFAYQTDLRLEVGSLPTGVNQSQSFRSHVINLEEVETGYGEINPKAVEGETKLVVTRLLLTGGELKATNLIVDDLNKPMKWTIGQRPISALSSDVTYTAAVADAEWLAIVAHNFAGDPLPGRVVFPHSGGQTVNLIIRNDCACAPIANQADDSFYWFYYLCKTKPASNCHIPTCIESPPPPGDNDTFCPGARFNPVP